MASGVLPAEASPLTLPAPAERGSTRIADRVLARIASRAAVEAVTPHAPDPRRLETPRASAHRHRRGTVSIKVGLDLPYPADIGALSGEVHQRIVERLDELAGTEAPKVSLVVERLVPDAPSGGLL
ncbi:hypothetical protein [Streptacidiphilus cavernicola]|uniref:Asp23/Gls24 family envelope stress response protein n=1 Tax=Streptacidiphilus cavernicola TaxID=3342716 RepID=A0ABV6W1K3_9ACTN